MRSRALFAAFGLMSSAICLGQYQAVIMAPPGAVSSAALSAGGNYQAGFFFDGATVQAALWSGSAASMINMHPPGMAYSEIIGSDGVQHVGMVAPIGSGYAALWTGTSNSWVDLNQASWPGSRAWAVGDGQQAGEVFLPGHQEAVVWSGTAASGVLLHPAGATSSTAYGVKGGVQVGYTHDGSYYHAALWSGTAASHVDMHPPGMYSSMIFGTDGNQHVGFVSDLTSTQAAVWTGTSTSPVYLNPPGVVSAQAWVAAGGRQGGNVNLASPAETHAAIWSGTAGSFVDLHQFLPPGRFDFSDVRGIGADGTIAGYALSYSTWEYVAVVWIPQSLYTFEGFLAPINEPPAPESTFHRGAVVRVRFKLFDENGVAVTSEEAHISVTKLGPVEAVVNESDYSMPSSDGTQFGVQGDTYSYNLATRNLERGCRYRITATYGQGSHSVTIAVV